MGRLVEELFGRELDSAQYDRLRFFNKYNLSKQQQEVFNCYDSGMKCCDIMKTIDLKNPYRALDRIKDLYDDETIKPFILYGHSEGTRETVIFKKLREHEDFPKEYGDQIINVFYALVDKIDPERRVSILNWIQYKTSDKRIDIDSWVNKIMSVILSNEAMWNKYYYYEKLRNDIFGEEYMSSIDKDDIISGSILESWTNLVLWKILDKRSCTVVMMYYGLYLYEKHTLEEIANEMRLTAERIRQIVAKAFRDLQRNKYIESIIYGDKYKKIIRNRKRHELEKCTYKCKKALISECVFSNIMHIQTRIQNVFKRNDIVYLYELEDMTIADLLSMRGLAVGLGTEVLRYFDRDEEVSKILNYDGTVISKRGLSLFEKPIFNKDYIFNLGKLSMYDIPNVDLEDCIFSKDGVKFSKIVPALKRNGINTVEDLVNASLDTIINIKGIGPTAFGIMIRFMKLEIIRE